MQPIIGPFDDPDQRRPTEALFSLCRDPGAENTPENLVAQIVKERPLLLREAYDKLDRPGIQLSGVTYAFDHFTVTPSSPNPSKMSVTVVFRATKEEV